MRASGTILCAIPGVCWGKQKRQSHQTFELLGRFLRDLASIERRLPKNVARDDEIDRYTRLCGQIEQLAISNGVFAPTSERFHATLVEGRFPLLYIGSEYVDLIRLLQLDQKQDLLIKGRIGATVFNPQEIKTHLQYFEIAAKTYGYQTYPAIKHRLWYLTARVIKNGCGLIEFPDPLSMSYQSELRRIQNVPDRRSWFERLLEQFFQFFREKPKPVISPEKRRTNARTNVISLSTSNDWQRYHQVDNRGEYMQDRLRSQIRAAIKDGTPVKLMDQRQNIITVILQEFIHKDKIQKPVEVPVVYNDGRTARPFPLHYLTKMPDGWTPTRDYHFALISMRHLPLDKYIDMNWYRNSEIPTKDGMAASDEYCYQISTVQLAEILKINKDHRLRIYLYHTGYMPAIIGFYRAVMSTLALPAYKPGCLQIVPRLQPDEKGFVEGKPWPE